MLIGEQECAIPCPVCGLPSGTRSYTFGTDSYVIVEEGVCRYCEFWAADHGALVEAVVECGAGSQYRTKYEEIADYYARHPEQRYTSHPHVEEEIHRG